MKNTKILRILSIVISLSLVMVAIPVTPVQAERTISLTPTEGNIGDTITITGAGFTASTDDTDKYVSIYFSSDEATSGNYIDNQVKIYKLVKDGAWVTDLGELGSSGYNFTVPAVLDSGSNSTQNVTPGTTYYVYVTHSYTNPVSPSTIIRAVAQFTVIGGAITINRNNDTVGTEVDITGTDFGINKSITIKYDGNEIDIEAGDTETDISGGFTNTIIIPEETAGVHTITVVVSGSEVQAEFTVKPEISLSPTSGDANITVTVSGTGFAKRQDVVFYFNNVEMATATTGSQGSFSTTINVPDLGAGIYDVEAEDEDSNIDKTKFTITVPPPSAQPPPAQSQTPSPPPVPAPAPLAPKPIPSPPPPLTAVSLNPASGAIGANLLISGTAFKASAAVTVRYDNEEVATATTGGNGMFVTSFQIPAGKHGNHTVSISDGTNTEQVTFVVESEAPAVPTPLLPTMEAELKPPISFDWEDAIDDSPPVTYSLQIATSNDFAEASLVLGKTGLTESEYTVTEEESPKLVSQEAPYYWRIRAIDGAANDGYWTGAGIFYVAKSFAIPRWVLYVLLILGGLLLFVIGYWVGRRTAYYY